MRRVVVLAATPLLIGLCAHTAQAETRVSDRGLKGFVTVDRLEMPDDPQLQAGRAIWGENCSNCHGGNKATGAPKITSSRAWGSRIEKGMDVLIDHALNGFVGPTYTQMPARGANPELTDTEVTQAVAFMVWSSGGADLVRAYLSKTKDTGQ